MRPPVIQLTDSLSMKQQSDSKISMSSCANIRGLQLKQAPRLLGINTDPNSVGIEDPWWREDNP